MNVLILSDGDRFNKLKVMTSKIKPGKEATK